jgi:hypothetical protein
MASKVKSHLPQPKQQSKPVPSVEWSNHLGSFKQFKDARREWRGLCDGDSRWSKKCSMATRTEFVRIVERMDELATQIVQSAMAGIWASTANSMSRCSRGDLYTSTMTAFGPFQPVARGISRSSCASSTIVGSGSADGGDTTIGSRPIVIVNSSFVGSVAQRRGFTCSEGWSALEFINCDADDIAALPSVVLKRRPREGMILLTHAEEATERHDRINCIASLLIDHDVVNLSEMHTIASSLKMYEPFSVALDGDRPVHVAAPLPAKALHLRFTGISVAYRCRTRRSSDYQIPPTALCIRPGIQVGTSCHAPPSWAHAPLS